MSEPDPFLVQKMEYKAEIARLRSLLWEAYYQLKHAGKSDAADALLEELKLSGK